VLFVILSLLLAIFQAKIKGFLGEKAVANRLSGLPKEQYRLLNDVMIKTNYGTTQIDHIVISVYGIFVIETKNYKGWITGGDNSEKWIKNMYGKKYPFRNPLKQNYAHIKSLEQLLDLSEDKFISIVAFVSSATIKVTTSKQVIYINQLRKVIESYNDILFSQEQIHEFEEKILSSNITSKESRKEHVQQIRTKVKLDNSKVLNGVCPKCGGHLINRNGKYGSFFGCSNYPKCKYSSKV
jgi:hypothetical protein